VRGSGNPHPSECRTADRRCDTSRDRGVPAAPRSGRARRPPSLEKPAAGPEHPASRRPSSGSRSRARASGAREALPRSGGSSGDAGGAVPRRAGAWHEDRAPAAPRRSRRRGALGHGEPRGNRSSIMAAGAGGAGGRRCRGIGREDEVSGNPGAVPSRASRQTVRRLEAGGRSGVESGTDRRRSARAPRGRTGRRPRRDGAPSRPAAGTLRGPRGARPRRASRPTRRTGEAPPSRALQLHHAARHRDRRERARRPWPRRPQCGGRLSRGRRDGRVRGPRGRRSAGAAA
jgi:hypothetical protein